MGIKIKLDNKTDKAQLIQVELTGVVVEIPPQASVVVDTDFEQNEEILMELLVDRIIVWGGVAASVSKDAQS